MAQSFDDIIKFLKQEMVVDSEKKPEQFKEALEKVRTILHDKVNVAKERLIDYGTQAFQKEDKKFTSNFTIEEKEEDKTKNIKSKVHDLVSSLDGMLKRTEFLDDSIKLIKEESTQNLLACRKGVLDFKITRKFQLKVDGKSLIDLGWKNPQNKPTYSTIDTKDPATLNINANSCYNYYQTDKEFTDENVEVMFVTNTFQSNYYHYFGIRNESNDPNNNCMCCSPASVTYFKTNGYVYQNGTSLTENKLNFNNTERAEFRVRVRFLGSEKKVYFEINEMGECGPYTITGSKFTFTSGSCNECHGFIRIDYCQLI